MKKVLVLAILSFLPSVVSAGVVASGDNCGTNCSWKVEDVTDENGKTSRVLTVYATDGTKTGSMASWSDETRAPTIAWKDYKSTITDVVIEGSATKNENGTYSNATGIVNIGYGAFSGCKKLKNVSVPTSVNRVESTAFDGASALSNINIPDSIKSINQSAFRGAKGLTELVLPSSVTSIANSAFSGATGLKSIKIEGAVKSLGRSAFEANKKLEIVELGYGMQTIGATSFKNATNLKTLIIPETVTKIEWNAFENTTSLKTLIIPASVKTIDSAVFKGSGLEELWCIKSMESKCKTAINSSSLDESILRLYTKTDDGKYIFNGKKYASLADMYAGKSMTKRIYTVPEAEAVSKPTGNKFRIRYK